MNNQEIEKAIKVLSSFDRTEDNELRDAVEVAVPILEKQLNNGWIPVQERLPEEKENPITWDYYEYTVTVYICGKYDIRHYKYGRGKWWNGGADMSSVVIAWQPLPGPYKEEII